MSEMKVVPVEPNPEGHLHLMDMVAVPRYVFSDFLNNQPGWPDTARRYLNAEALATHQAATPDGSQWRPIETAPRDGTLVMVGAPDCGVSLVRWMLDTWIDEQGFTQGSWPTHWQPLPAAPEGGE